ncbi:MAG: ferritin-like domain-containing protein [Cyclobacteriaceae bacterium]
MSVNERNKATIDTINKLIEICKDGEKGYKDAASQIEDDEFQTILNRLSQQRALFRAELENDLIKDYGVEPKSSDSLKSKLHRNWMDFKAGLSSNDTKSVLEECERGEKHAIDAYTDALKGQLPSYIDERVRNQLDMIKGTLGQVRAFKSEVSNA